MGRGLNGRPNKSGRNDNSRDAFARLPHFVQSSAAYAASAPNARVLLLEILSIHNGENNGSPWLSVRDSAHRMGLASIDSARLIRRSDCRWLPLHDEGRSFRCEGFEHIACSMLAGHLLARTRHRGCRRMAQVRADRQGAGSPDGMGARRAQRLPQSEGPRKNAGTRLRYDLGRSHAIQVRSVPGSGTAKLDNDAKQPKSVVPDSCTYIAMTVGSGAHALLAGRGEADGAASGSSRNQLHERS